jgi:hypothetical protein
MIGSAGNENRCYVKFPAAYNECLAIGADLADNDPNDPVRAPYSNHGVALDLIAPGGDFQDRNGDRYPESILAQSFDGGAPSGMWDLWWAAGTSAASAEVSGIAGVLMSLGLDRDEVLAVLKGTASKVLWNRDESSGAVASINAFDCETGYGLVDVNEAIECALTGVIPQFPEYQTSVSVSTKRYHNGASRGEAEVTVYEESYWWGGRYWAPASGVTVYGYWAGSAVGGDSEVTDWNGKCRFKSAKTDKRDPSFEFVITNIVQGGKSYDDTTEVLPPDASLEGDAMIVRPLRSTGGAVESGLYDPWYTEPGQGIY